MSKCKDCKEEGIVEKLLKLIDKPVSLAKALASGQNEQLGKERLGICLRCEELESSGIELYCKECGCPKNSISELHNKLQYIDLKCPLNKW